MAIIGGGPAGFSAALAAADLLNRQNRAGTVEILVLEKMKRPGRKLLLTGAGQCNLTRREEPGAFLDRYGGSGKQGRFLKRALYAYPPAELIRFFEERGVPLEDNASEGGSNVNGGVLLV